MMQAQLHNIPALTKAKVQLSALEVHELRMWNTSLEMLVKSTPFYNSTIPIQYVMSRDHPPVIDSIVHVCCALCNVCESVVPFE